MTLNPLNYCNGARPVAIHQAAAVPDSLPRRSPPTRLEEPRKSWGARRRRGNATGQPKKVPEKTKQHIKVCHWNAEGVSNKTVELSKFLHDLFRVSEDLLLDRRSRVRQATEHGVYLEGSSPSDFHHLSDWTNDSRTTRL